MPTPSPSSPTPSPSSSAPLTSPDPTTATCITVRCTTCGTDQPVNSVYARFLPAGTISNCTLCRARARTAPTTP